MKIEDSRIFMSSSRTLVEKYEKKEELRMWEGRQPQNAAPGQPSIALDVVDLSREARDLLSNIELPEVKADKQIKEAKDKLGEGLDHKTLIRKLLIEILTGRKIKVSNIEIADPEEVKAEVEKIRPQGNEPNWGAIYRAEESYSEEESLEFTAEGVIKTADNKEIKFKVDINMERSFFVRNSEELMFGNAKKVDPLVVNFSGNSAALTDMKFSFDLDADGDDEKISFVASGSGFLALDINSDGKINDGSELFGPSTSNGFSELSAYDSDNNGWIDEGDIVFKNLKIWTKDAQGTDSLTGLKEKGIGAIYLNYAANTFSIKDSQNNLHGEVKSTGIFVGEKAAGTVQQVDLAV